MARKFSGWSRSFMNDPQLKQYYLNGVVPTDKKLGVGSYGSVVEVKYQQVPCAAKRMHELLLDPGNQGVSETIQKYRQECQLMASLRHPNITQFLGLCFLEGSELPLLVMEKLEMSVDDLLVCAPNIPLPVKISILTDTSSGLVYLHGRTPPIIHRDLTARNILLTASLTAKITDMGNSRMVHFKPDQLAQTMSKNPGTAVYMPPEALNDSHRYGPSLDIFSFGHLALYVLIQVFPGDLLSATLVDPHNPGEVVGRSEVKRREVYIKKLENQLLESYPILVELVTNCLHNNPQTRPSAEQLLGKLQIIKEEIDKMYGGNFGRVVNTSSVLQMKEIKLRDKRIYDLEVRENALEAEIADLTEMVTRLKIEKQSLESANTQITCEKNQVSVNCNKLKTDLRKVQEEKHLLVADNTQLKTDKSQIHIENTQLISEKNRLKAENDKLFFIKDQLESEKVQLESHYQQEKYSLQMEVEQLTRKLRKTTVVHDENISMNPYLITFPLKLDWKRGPDMSKAVSGYILSVEINGIIYVGGGTGRYDDVYVITAYSTQSCQWHSLPLYNTKWFAMTTINGKLVLVGGKDKDDSDSSELGEWQSDSNQWTYPFPPMSTPRWNPAATSYEHWLVVAGGCCHGVCLHSIEVLDVSNMQWSTGPSTPTPWMSMKSVYRGDTWYLMGGWCVGVGWSPDVYSVSLEALVSQSASDSSNIWKKLPSLDCRLSCPLVIGGSLLAVGGQDMKCQKPVSTIQRYVPETNTWIQAGLLPHAVYNCTCILTSDNLHVTGGQNGKTTLKNMFTSHFL